MGAVVREGVPVGGGERLSLHRSKERGEQEANTRGTSLQQVSRWHGQNASEVKADQWEEGQGQIGGWDEQHW